jgi:hypothetical protein
LNQEEREARRACRELQRRADEITDLILARDYPAIDVVIEIRNLKEYVRDQFPERVRLFEMVYEGRFRRLWSQFREQSDGPLPEW